MSAMTTLLRKALMAVLVCSVFTLPVWADKVKTDGKNKDSPIKVLKMDFSDSGYGLPSPNAEIRLSTTIQNSSTTDDLKNVVIHLQLKNLEGDVVQEWTKNLALMKKGTTAEFTPDGIYYNYSFNNLQGAVMVEHDKIEPKTDAEAKPK